MKALTLLFLPFVVINVTRAFENNYLSAFDGGDELLIADSLDKVETFEDEKFNYTITCNSSLKLLKIGTNESNFWVNPSKMKVKLKINDISVANIGDQSSTTILNLDCENENEKVIEITAGHLGITKMSFQINMDDNSKTENVDVDIRVKRRLTLFDKLAFFILGPLILLNKCAFGAKIEISTLKHVFRYPDALAICLGMQFIIMPLLGVLYGLLFKLSEAMALALFVGATCPGGGGGYVISYLVGGDVTLAISASLLSTVVAMGAMPAIIGLYAYIMKIPDTIAIPYVKMVLILCAIAVPISLGMFINHRWPKFAKKFVKIIQPLSLFLIFCGFLFIGVTSKYIINGPRIGWVLAVLLPTSGFVLSIFVARCFGQSWPFAKAISLESGMKNTVLGIAVIELTYPQPEADLSTILIIMVTLGHTSLAMLWYFVHLFKRKCFDTVDEKGQFMKLESISEDDDSDDFEVTEFVALTK